jgi:hypothetical protein
VDWWGLGVLIFEMLVGEVFSQFIVWFYCWPICNTVSTPEITWYQMRDLMTNLRQSIIVALSWNLWGRKIIRLSGCILHSSVQTVPCINNPPPPPIRYTKLGSVPHLLSCPSLLSLPCHTNVWCHHTNACTADTSPACEPVIYSVEFNFGDPSL